MGDYFCKHTCCVCGKDFFWEEAVRVDEHTTCCSPECRQRLEVAWNAAVEAETTTAPETPDKKP